jgi:Tol biopolymer transport system component
MNPFTRFTNFWQHIVFLSIYVFCLGIDALAAPPFRLVSATGPEFGPPAGGGGDSYLAIVSRDGRFVLFASTAENLVSLGTNRPLPSMIPAPINVFLRDRKSGSTVLVSVNLDGTGGGDADSTPIGVSTNGRYALFESTADNLVSGDTNNASDVFVRDVVAGTTTLVSTSTNGGCGDDSSYSSGMTPDGHYVVFSSAADNLVAGDTNGIPDVFVRDLTSNVTTLVSVGAQLTTSPYSDVGSDAPIISPDARYVAFYSTAANLVPGVQNIGNLFLRDRLAGTTTWVSSGALNALGSVGVVTNAVSFNHLLSDDGRFVAFEALAFPQGSPAVILRYDAQTRQTALIETNAVAPAAGNFQGIQDLAMTPDGRFVAYPANAIDSSGSTTVIRVWDGESGVSILASGNLTNGISPGTLSDSPALDESGNVVAFVSDGSDLVTNAMAGDFHMYRRDLKAGVTQLVDVDTNGVGSLVDPIAAPAMSGDGRFLAFDCQDGDLVPADRNRAYDVFLRDFTNTSTELISAHDPGLPSFTPDGASGISSFSLSADARLIAFWGEADDLVMNDTNGLRDIYMRDLLAGTNLLVSINTNGVAGDGLSTDPTISADGQYIAFSSLADDLVIGDSNRAEDVFILSLQKPIPQLVSINAAGTGPGNGDSYSPILSSNGQFVLFRSKAGNLAPGMTSGVENLFWRDLQAHSTSALTTNGVTAASMTPDGRVVAFITSSLKTFSTTLSDRLYQWDSQSKSIVFSLNGAGGFGSVALSPNGQRLAFTTNTADLNQLQVLDLSSGTNWIIASYRPSSSSTPRFSADGGFLTYAGSLGVPIITNQVFVFDIQNQTNLLVSRSWDGSAPGDANSDSPDISSDGRLIAYRSAADNLVPGDNNGAPDIFLYDRLSRTTTLVTVSRFSNASADNRSLTPVFSQDGHTLVFESWASDLLSGDFNNNVDIFAVGLDSGTLATGFAVTLLPEAAGNWLTWQALIGKSYRAQFKNSLSDSAWQELGGQVVLMGSQAYLKDAILGVGQRFYRIISSP